MNITTHQKHTNTTILLLTALAIFITACTSTGKNRIAQEQQFDGERAYQDVKAQVGFGARIPGTAAHADTVQYIQEQLSEAQWVVELQETTKLGHPIRNIIAKRGAGNPWIILGAHYDTRLQADKDPNASLRQAPVPGANDGASGVAVLLELARVLPEDIPGQLWLVFFDAEDNGNFPDWDWILGSQAFVESLETHPDAAVIVDMIGDADLNIHKEKNSSPELTNSIWETAESLGYSDYFIPEEKFPMLDDHTPFIRVGIPAVDIIDFDYPYYHTTQDTVDKVSPHSLKVIGDTLYAWLSQGQ